MAAAWLLVGCTSDEEVNPKGNLDGAILFDVAGFAETRAPGMMDLDGTTQPISLQEKGFGVFASYTALEKYEDATVSTDFMYNQEVRYFDDGSGNTGWSYSPVKYWPNYTENSPNEKEYLSFFAYAPYEADPQNDGRCIFAVSKNFAYGDPWINYRLAEDPWSATNPQVDLCFGMKEDGGTYTPWTDQTKDDFNLGPDFTSSDKLKFTFLHALCCIGDEIYIKMDDDLFTTIDGYATVTIDKITVTYKNLTTKARLVLNSVDGTPNWKEIISGELTCTRSFVLDNTNTNGFLPFTFDGTNYNQDDNLVSDQFGLLFIPLQIAGTEAATAEVSAEYTVVNNASETYTGTATGTFKLLENAGTPYVLEPGQKNAIRINLTKDFDLAHLVYPLGTEPATEPSYIRKR